MRMLACICLSALIFSAHAQEDLRPRKAYKLVDDLFEDNARKREKAANKLMEAGDLTVAPALIEVVFFSDVGRPHAVKTLNHLLGTNHPADYKTWVAAIGRREDIVPKPGYLDLKAKLFGWIDPAFADFLDPKHRRTIRAEEIVWGGVKKDGIPALANPDYTTADEASFLQKDEQVFGVSFNGESRAYPFRIMDWHEMVNDRVGGQPFSISYCTLCGAGIAFDTSRDNREPYIFGSSGLLYRSNKLMYDRGTDTLWKALSGEPAMGPLVGKGDMLPVLPLTVTTWGAWRQQHPETTVITRDTGHQRDYRPGAAYGSYFGSDELMFPVWTDNPADMDLARKDWLWVVVLDGARKAYPLRDLADQPILHDRFNDTDLVLITDPTTQAVRVYAGDDRQLQRVDDAWQVGGTAVTLTAQAITGSDIHWPRVAGHRAYWFTWGAFFPNAPVYQRPQ